MRINKLSSTLTLWMSVFALSIPSVHPVYAGDLTDQQKTELQALEKIQAQENAGRKENTQNSQGNSNNSGQNSYSVPAPAYHNVTGISIDTNSVNLQVGCTTHTSMRRYFRLTQTTRVSVGLQTTTRSRLSMGTGRSMQDPPVPRPLRQGQTRMDTAHISM